MENENTIKKLSQNEKKVLLTLSKIKKKVSPKEIFENGDFDKDVEVINAASWLQTKKLVKIEDNIKSIYFLGNEGKIFLKKGFPERRAINLLVKKKKISLNDLVDVLEKNEIPIAIGWLKKKGWANVTKENNTTIIEITTKGKNSVKSESEEERILRFLDKNPGSKIDKNIIKKLISRKNVIREKEIISSLISLTNEGIKIIRQGIKLEDEISQITSSIIIDNKWKNKNIRPYDINAFSPTKYGGKFHPLSNLISKIRQIFLEMGFTEIEGDFVESCFWNMDMLFIPQDHPAREMQDTLYCKVPSIINIKEKDLIDTISNIHENGGITSSTGWGYKFSKDNGKKPLLRTHTTVNTIRYLYNNPNPPSKIFSIGKVFRKENIDNTHLPEFFQIEGIVNEENTNFRQLIGILKEFYRRIGFEKIRFRPAYFPYTEPSMEVEVFWNDEWMELGGSGIFRPEVTEPVNIKNPVLAWGLGLERLAMLKFDLTDIRELYLSDLGWLKKISLL